MREGKTIPQPESALLTVDEAANYIRMGKTTFYECLNDGSIAFIRPPRGKILVKKTVLDTWLNTHEIPASKVPRNRKEAVM